MYFFMLMMLKTVSTAFTRFLDIVTGFLKAFTLRMQQMRLAMSGSWTEVFLKSVLRERGIFFNDVAPLTRFSVQRKATPGNILVTCLLSVNSLRWMVWAVRMVWKWEEMMDMMD